MSLNYANDRGLRTFRNGSGEDVPQYGVLEIGGLDILPRNNETGFKNKQVFIGGKISEGKTFAIAQQAIPFARYGQAMIQGVTPCKLKVVDDAHQYATASTSRRYLKTTNYGRAEILWKSSENPDQFGAVDAVVSLDNTPQPLEHCQFSLYGTGSDGTVTGGSNESFMLQVENSSNPVYQSGNAFFWSDVFGPTTADFTGRPGPYLLLKKAGTYMFWLNFEVQFPDVASAQTITAELRLTQFDDEDGTTYGSSVIGKSLTSISDGTDDLKQTLSVHGVTSLTSTYLPVELRLWVSASANDVTISPQIDTRGDDSRNAYRNVALYYPASGGWADLQHQEVTPTGSGRLNII